MPYCPICRSEFQQGVARCSDCSAELVEVLPEPQSHPTVPWVEVFSGNSSLADAVAGTLEAAGIETLTPDEYVSNLGWYAPSAIERVRVLVPEPDAVLAREMLAGLHRPPEEQDPGPVPASSPADPRRSWVPLRTLVLRSLGDACLAFALPFMITASSFETRSQGALFLASLLLQPCLLGVAMWRRRRITTKREPVLKLRTKGAVSGYVMIGFIVGLLLAGLGWIYQSLVGALPDEPYRPSDFGQDLSISTIMKVILSVGFAPICEEIFYRGTILGAFAASRKSRQGLMFSAALFSVMHLNPIGAPLYFIDGLILGRIFLGTRTLLVPIIAHATVNVVAALTMKGA